MDIGAIVLVSSLVFIVVLYSIFRGKAGVRHKPEVVHFVLLDVKMNQSLSLTFYDREKIRGLEQTNWEMNKSKIEFLGESLKDTLRSTFVLVEEINKEVKAIKKDKTRDRHEIDISRLAEPLTKCREGLEAWLMEMIGTTEVPPRYPTMMGTFFGER